MTEGNDSPRIPVVAAVIEVDGTFLLTKRQPGTHLAGLWEFPGGKVDAGETYADALRRELREELGVDADVGARLLETHHVYPERTVVLSFYVCRLVGTPVPMLGQEMRWVARDDLRSLGLPPADAELIRLLAGSAAG